MSVKGSCLCGSIKFRILRSHLAAMHCYCQMCRQAHGGAFSTHVFMRADQFELLSGQLRLYPSSEQGRREFCGKCGSHVKVHGQTNDGSVSVPAGLLDSDATINVVGHIFVTDKVTWYEISDSLPQHPYWPQGVEHTHPLST